jgi:hypothetical protein
VFIQDKGFGIAIWEMGKDNIRIRNSVFYNTTKKENWTGAPAIYIDNSKDWYFTDIEVVNNVFHNLSYGVRIKGKQIQNVKIANNLFLESGNKDVQVVSGDDISGIQVFHNLKYNDEEAEWSLSGVNSTYENIVQNPLIKATASRQYDYYKLSEGSLAIDAGVDVGLPYSGSAPDIGAFEYEF